jgi:hypothetical protein
MLRILRILNATLLVASTLVCLSAAGLWLRSHRAADTLSYPRNDHLPPDGILIRRYISIKSSRGKLIAGRGYFSSLLFRSAAINEGLSTTHDSSPPPGPQARTIIWSRLGFTYTRVNSPGMLVSHALWLPHWIVVAASAIAPALWLLKKHRQSTRSAANRCANCGYDLRATPNRCPECGARPAPPPATVAERPRPA